MPNIGHMRHQIALQKPTNTRDAGGGVTEAYTTLVNLWAMIESANDMCFNVLLSVLFFKLIAYFTKSFFF